MLPELIETMTGKRRSGQLVDGTPPDPTETPCVHQEAPLAES
jgi:hypothetical protein